MPIAYTSLKPIALTVQRDLPTAMPTNRMKTTPVEFNIAAGAVPAEYIAEKLAKLPHFLYLDS